ncbi:MAG TPA: hypothetical protein VLE73_05300 [Candidatus Saccharimonadales bacterium]|nr:hypothetical protein [Candidatus Saccharimonadales bacterium]
MTVVIEIPVRIDSPQQGAVTETPLSDSAIWSTAYRALGNYGFCLSCASGASAEAVARTTELARNNVLASSLQVPEDMKRQNGITFANCAHEVRAYRERRARKVPVSDDPRIVEGEREQYRSFSSILLAGDELVHAPDYAVLPVDDEAAVIIHGALRMAANHDYADLATNLEAADVLRNGIHVLRSTVSVAA